VKVTNAQAGSKHRRVRVAWRKRVRRCPERRVVQQMLTPAMRHGEHAAAVAALDLPTVLDSQQQPAAALPLSCQDTHPGTANITAAVGQPSLQSTSPRPSSQLLGRY
jgi:hypothetical protein